MFAFLSQAVTGVFLAMYYDPSRRAPTTASSTSPTTSSSASSCAACTAGARRVMIVLIFLHMGRTFFFGAYKYPRELNWVIGVVLLVLTLAMGLTGYLLPFDQRSFWATVVAVNITGTGPVRRALPGRLPARRARVRGHHADALLCDPHAADPGPDRGADRRPPLPGHQARHDRAALAQGEAAGAAREASRSEAESSQ